MLSSIRPFRSGRDFVRGLFEPEDCRETFADAPLEIPASHGPHGHCAKSKVGEVRNLTGVDSPGERPNRPGLRLETEKRSPEECVEFVARSLE